MTLAGAVAQDVAAGGPKKNVASGALSERSDFARTCDRLLYVGHLVAPPHSPHGIYFVGCSSNVPREAQRLVVCV